MCHYCVLPTNFNHSRVRACEILQAAGVPCSLILDSAVAYVMDKINLVLLGSEAVVESGGLVNAVGSYQMSIVAKAANKPIYALAERYAYSYNDSSMSSKWNSRNSSFHQLLFCKYVLIFYPAPIATNSFVHSRFHSTTSR